MIRANSFLWIDIVGLSLTEEDRDILSHPAVAGVILFSRNFESLAQLRSLAQSIRAISPDLWITVDQEGGRVQRFQEGFTKLPSMQSWGKQYQLDSEKTRRDLICMVHTMAAELHQVGIQSSLVPVLDIDYGRNHMIGERSFGTKELVLTLGDIFIDALHAANMPAIGKHFPGHGFVTADSHVVLPIDDRDFETIAAQDLQPFQTFSKKLDVVMPAHVVYSKCDAMPAGFSTFWLQNILRDQLKFTGIIVCDDLSMRGAAQFGSYADRARLALRAGCDVLLVCNNRDGVVEILEAEIRKSA